MLTVPRWPAPDAEARPSAYLATLLLAQRRRARMMSEGNTVTCVLRAWQAGDEGDLDRLMSIVYEELRALASRQMQGERVGHTLQPTAVVHEAFLRLSGSEIQWTDRVHFFAVIAATMRRVLVDHAKARRRDKRGGGAAHVSLDEALHVVDGAVSDVIVLDEALTRLAVHEPRKARVVELHYFGGLNYDEIASTLDVSAATVDRDLRFAKAWLRTELRPPDETR
jgi:RNA polymerase sigma factor (TIGR02999 family)